MKTIRIGTFETNSSSTHTLVMLSKAEYDKFVKGELFYDEWYSKLVTKAEIEEIAKEKDYSIEEYIQDNVKTYEEFGDGKETFEQEYTTPNGETVVAFGYFGYDG